MLTGLKYLLFLCLVSLAVGNEGSKPDLNFRASFVVNKGVIPESPWDYLNNKISDWFQGILRDKPILRAISNLFSPKNETRKVHKEALRQSENKKNPHEITNDENIWKIVRHFNKKTFFRVSQARRHFSEVLRINDSSKLEKEMKSQYNMRMQTYLKELLSEKEKSNSELDRQFILFDIIENCNHIMVLEVASIWHNMSSKYRLQNKRSDDSKMQHDKILFDFIKTSFLHKVHDYDYVCKEMKVCRSFPSYIDYVGDILEQVIVMSKDKKGNNALVETITILKNRHKSITTIFGTKITRRLDKVFQNVVEMDKTHTKSLLVSSYEFIKNRRFWQHDMDIKNVVARVMMDMIDKSFVLPTEQRIKDSQFYHNKLENQFMSLLNAFNQSNDAPDTKHTVAQFVDYTLQHINQTWDQDAKREAVTIMEVIFDDRINSPETYTRLMSTGSRYLNSG